MKTLDKAMRNTYAPHTDFGFLLGAIPSNPKAIPSNIDMVIERRNKFFIGEWKRPNEEISIGQKILLRALAKMPNFFVYVIEGWSTKNETVVNGIYRLQNNLLRKVGKGKEDLRDIYCSWYNSVEGK